MIDKTSAKNKHPLNIEYKLIIYFILIASIPLLVVYFTTYGLLISQFRGVQSERLDLTHHNLMTALENEKHNLYVDTIDYAHWSDMFDAVNRKDHAWLSDDFNIISSPQKGVGLIYALNLEGEVVYENRRYPSFFADCKDYLKLTKDGKEFVTLAGIGDRLFIVSFTHILDSEKTGVRGGYLIFGKEINKVFMDKLPKGDSFTYDFVYNGKGALDKKVYNDYFQYIKAPGDEFNTNYDNIQYFKLHDYMQRTVAMVYVNEIGSFVKNALHNMKKGLATSAVITFLLAIIFLNVLKNNIMHPIRLLRQRVKTFRNKEYSIVAEQQDEIMLLTDEFAAMCEEISKHDQELEKKNKRLEYLVYRDDITEAFNKRYFRKCIAKEYGYARDNDGLLSLLVINIDNYKFYGEMVGRNIGNIALKKIYEILISITQEKGFICYDGSDEFRIILPGIEYKSALSMADNISRKISESSFIGMQKLPKGHLSVSCGLASFPKDALELSKLVDAAEDRLRRTKYYNQAKVGYFYSIFNSLRDDIGENKKALIYMSKAFLSVIDAMDEYTYTHTEGVIKYASIIANELELAEDDKENIKIGALLHDIGKLELGRDLLNKKEKLTDEEMVLIRQHPAFAVNMLKPLEYFDDIINIVKYHHERYDGCGYPEGLRGDSIPLLARVVAVADSFDAMTTARAYRAVNKSFQEAIEELIKCSGSQFDPAIVDVFVKYVEKNGYNFLLVE